jgi:hypothetical protein
MAMEERTPDLREHIAYAEDWLARARRQVDQGEHARGVLTLLLAEAEVQRARERAMASATPDPAARRRPHPVLAAAVAVVFLGAGLTALWQRPAAPIADAAAGPPVVVFDTTSGSMLHMVQASAEPIERTVVRPVVVRVLVPHAPTAEAVRSPAAVAALRLVPAPVAAPAPAPASARPPVSPAPAVTQASPAALPPVVLLSEADLIELVLAAERSLRRTGGQ